MDLLKSKVREREFLTGKGLGNEVPFWVFDYPPEKEILMRKFIEKLTTKSMDINILDIDLYDLCLEIFNNKGFEEKILDLEQKKGSEKLFSKLKHILKTNTINKEIRRKIDSSDSDLIFITGVGKVWPLLRSHTLLNNLQAVVQNKTLVMFYPGKYSGKDLQFFGKFKDGNYYRAFRLIPEE